MAMHAVSKTYIKPENNFLLKRNGLLRHFHPHTMFQFWAGLLKALKSSEQFLKCGDNPEKGCQERCRGAEVNLICTAMWKCNTECEYVQTIQNKLHNN